MYSIITHENHMNPKSMIRFKAFFFQIFFIEELTGNFYYLLLFLKSKGKLMWKKYSIITQENQKVPKSRLCFEDDFF